ncbi:unnamed protein product [Caenorhabditis angaria]|uniref:Seven TM Receptor n=1 Tax=Caenorhabditis angaria TaxID=860376 RepID=A0A9P1IWH5_9PELO|nr:unnamed protein product [Caenorhabditis angaria]
MYDWITVTHIIAQVGYYTTTFFGTTLMCLTYFGVKRSFGMYKYLMMVFTGLGMVFATLEYLIYPTCHAYNAGYIFFFASRPFGAPKSVMEVAASLYTMIFAATISLLAVQFLYRYWAVFDAPKLKWFKGCRFVLWILYALTFGSFWGLSCYFLTSLDDFSINYMRQEMTQIYHVSITEVPCFAVVIYTVQYAIIIYCGTLMKMEMNEKLQKYSPSLRKLHKQFFLTLILQISGPTLFLFIPIFIFCFVPFLDIEVSLPTGILLCAFTLYPAVDAIIVMCCISDYRNAIRKSIKSIIEAFPQIQNKF